MTGKKKNKTKKTKKKNIELDVNTIIQDLDQEGTYKYLGGTRETESSTLRSKRRPGKSTTAGSGWYSSRS